jgi:hypothetical protein
MSKAEERISINKPEFDDYHLPEDDNHHSHRRGNLKSYKPEFIFLLNNIACDW